MRNRPSFDWNKNLAALREARETETQPVLTDEQRRAQLKAQRDARVNAVMRSGLSQRNRA